MSDFNTRIETALGAMSLRPRPLRAYLEKPGPDFESASASDLDRMLDLLLSTNPNEPARVRFSNLLRSWDNAKNVDWTQTARNSAVRRKAIHEILKSTAEDESRIDLVLPFYSLEEPLIVSEKHQDWYEPKAGIRDYYWSKYVQYLKEKRHWNDVSILTIDNSTRAIVECLGNPESSKAYASRGLVMGYVQSGKTANFAGVVARAADAGYRLIIVLAGTWNILRNQTQRRLDKELLGKELLKNDETYIKQPPSDWDEFLEHGNDPAELGHFAWQRLTRPDIDLRRLKQAIDNLEFERRNKAARLYDPSNLHTLPVKLLVIKKHAGILSGLIKDLALLSTALAELPVLIIDDESDQAGLNTVDPRATGKKRAPTNQGIVELLKLFPRGQYVGYTATPYANALVDPDDPEDLYPKDFIVSLDRPPGYMGVADFFDPLSAYEDLDPNDYGQPEIAYIRRVESAPDQDDEDLQKALRSYVLAGGIKLFRRALKPQHYKSEYFRHHTMLVHTSTSKGAHVTTASRVEELWLKCAFNSPKGLRELGNLWEADHRKVSQAVGNGETLPASFDDLRPHLAQAIGQIEEGNRIFRVVNSDTDDAPDFGAGPVWKILIGGNKLSRGYTVEGLTVSYYRRVSNTADTLMQMGRWFGFRPGYRDLVRVFLGVKEGKKGDTDLVALFKDVCQMEERFREEIKRYIRVEGAARITPKDIPPLIAISGSLPPTARNKMFNARIKNKNFGGRRSMLTMTPETPARRKANIDVVTALLESAKALGQMALGGSLSDGKQFEADALVFRSSNESLIQLLNSYRWVETEYKDDSDRPADVNLQIEFLTKQKHEISNWLIVAPQRSKSFGKAVSIDGVGQMAVKHRGRGKSDHFQVFGEPRHRDIADFLAGIKSKNPMTPNSATKALQSAHTGVLLLYPVRENETDLVSMGYELFFSPNSLPYDTGFTVRRHSDEIVVEEGVS
ncbi:Z1 domain-containing protein [Bradyrhizobium sp. USDA 4506]